MSYARIRTCRQEKWYDNVIRIEGLRGYDQGATYLVLHLSEHPTRVCYWIGKGSPTSVLLCATGADVTTALKEEACARLDRQIENNALFDWKDGRFIDWVAYELQRKDRIYYESITSSIKETNPPLLPSGQRSETSPSRYAPGSPPQAPQPQGQGGAGGIGGGRIPGDVEQGSGNASGEEQRRCRFCGQAVDTSLYHYFGDCGCYKIVEDPMA